MEDRHSNNLNLPIQKPSRRAKSRLNKTERTILHFLLACLEAGDEHHTYSNDPSLLKFIKKSQPQASRALHSLSDRGLLLATPEHHISGSPRIYHLIWYKLKEARELLKADGYVSALIASAYGRAKVGSVTTPELAHILNVRKRTAQRIAHTLVDAGVWRRTKNGKKRRYVETRGQLPLEHFSKKDEKEGAS